MALIVQKYGGSSLATPERIKEVGKGIIKTKKEGNSLVVVVSAMGDTTDNLISLMEKVNPDPPKRELDLLLSTGEMVSAALLAAALEAEGEKAVALTAYQGKIITDDFHTKARIKKIRSEKILEELNRGKIVVVAGFQGITPEETITTLGRGGSDTTAVALAAALKAQICEIYTDVEGVFTADPRIVPEAKKLKKIVYDEMLELASLGAKVLHLRAVEVAKKFNVPLHIRSSFTENEGTIIMSNIKNEREKEMREASGKIVEEPIEGFIVTGVVLDETEAKITVRGVPDKPGVAGFIFGKLAEANINVDMIVQSSSPEGKNTISFTVEEKDLPQVRKVMEKVGSELRVDEIIYDPDMAKVSIVGAGMQSHPGVAARMFTCLGNAGINIDMISTSEIKISCVIRKKEGKKAVRLVHEAFELDKEIPEEAS